MRFRWQIFRWHGETYDACVAENSECDGECDDRLALCQLQTRCEEYP